MLSNVSNGTITSNGDFRGLRRGIPTSFSPAITSGLLELSDILAEEKQPIKNYDDLYSAAVSILKLVAAKERRLAENQPKQEEQR